MPGAGKSAIGRRLAARLGLPFQDADTEIENAAGLTVAEIFARYGEAHFRDGERRVIGRIVAGPPVVLATGGGAFVDPRTRAALREAGALTVWLRASIPVLKRRIVGRSNRPLFIGRDPEEVLQSLMAARTHCYAEADIALECGDDPPEVTTARLERAIAGWARPSRLTVALSERSYEVVVGTGLLPRAGGW
ncbi:shikimate kinase [Roseomonas sp. CCTCC AB2023176]|uniref:shikimate kinase n=1 Tax=Roseomonas sp. CCTCC AB2023176 TaxID=3342640 RepID=UPI0035DCDE0C